MKLARYRIFLLLLTVVACETEPPETEPQPLRAAAEEDSLVALYSSNPEHPLARRALALVSNPLGVEDPVGLGSYQRAFQGCEATRSPTPNRHDSTQTDTAVTLDCDGITLQLYQLGQGEKAFLVKAEVKAKTLAIGPFYVGMDAQAARDSARALWLPATETNLRLVLQDPEVGNRLSVFLRRGRVSKLVYEGYVD